MTPMDTTPITQTLLPVVLPAPVLAVLAALLATLWVWSHRLSRGLSLRWQIAAFAGRSIVGTLTLVISAELANRIVTLATHWPLWLLLTGGAVLVETIVVLYHLERQTLRRMPALTLSMLRVALLLSLIAMLCQPVLVLTSTRRVQRQVAIVLDDTASMQVADTGMNAAGKMRLAEALGVPAALRPCHLDETADQLRGARGKLQALADLLVSFADTDPSARGRQLRKRGSAVRNGLGEAHASVCAQTNALAKAAAAASLHGDQPLQTAINALAARLKAEIAEPIAAARDSASGLDKDDAPAALHESLLATTRRTATQLEDIAAKLDPLADKLDEAVYRAMKEPERATVDRAASAPRAAVARTLLARRPTVAGVPQPSLIERLDAEYGVRLYVLGTAPAETPVKAFVETPTQTNAPAETATPTLRTDLAAALTKVMTDLPAEQTAGVLLLSDGRHNTPSPVEPVARALGLQQTPVSPIVFGRVRPPPSDVAIAAADAPETVSTNDKVAIDIDLKLDGLAGSNVVVQLFDGDRLVASNAVKVAGDAVRRRLQLSDVPRTNGLHHYRVMVPPLASEVLTNNNECALPVNVGTDPIKVLLIEGRPRWEFRYLKNLFVGRDATVRLQYVLFHPDRVTDMPAPPARIASVTNSADEAEATALPATDEDWMKFDVIVLGDVDPVELGARAMQTLRAFVTVRGGPLVVIAGPRHMPHAYMGSPLADILPVQCLATDRPVLTAPEPEFRMVPTAEGREHILLRMADDPEQNAAAWDSVPPIRWRHALRNTKEGATVLAYALPADPPESLKLKQEASVPDEETLALRRQFERENALVVAQHVAMGNVLFLATDNTWRLRYRRGDVYHHRFWGQVMRWATADRLAGGTPLARLGTDRPRYAVNTPVNVRARLMSADFTPIRQASVYATVWSGDRKLVRRNLPYVADSSGMYAADLGSFAEGTYRVELDVSEVQGLPAPGAPLSTEFAVTPEIVAERVELSADQGLLTRIASSSGGLVTEPPEIERAIATLGPSVVTHRERRQIELWDSWPFFLLIVALATAEWILRKKERLP